MHTWPLRIIVILVAFIVAGASALLLFGGGSSATKPEQPGDGRDAGSRATSDIWAVGDAWTVKVRQDAATISPDPKRSVAEIPFRFKVTGAPKQADGEWTIHVTQDGAEGPFKDGWRLWYREDAGAMHITRVAAAGQRPIEATVATIVLGSNFPYETTYEAAPKDATVDSAVLARRAAAPPSIGLDGATTKGKRSESGARPPVNAPVLKPGEIPPGAPGSKY